MTISEQLQFSVLTAPVATLDRRTLSQAWYSALYGSRQSTTAAAHSLHAARPDAVPVLPRAVAATSNNASLKHSPVPVHAGKPALHAEGTTYDRRAPRSALARRIERVFLRPRSVSRKKSFTIEGEHGRVHVLLRSCGTRLKLVAICPAKARTQVAAALAQARYALALRGIDLDVDAREAAPC